MAKKKTKTKLTPLLTIHEVARILRVTPITLRRWDEKGLLKAVRIGDRWEVGDRRYRPQDIKRFIAEGLLRKKTRK